MPESASLRQIADALSLVCDAVYDLVAKDEFDDAIRRLEEAAAAVEVRRRPKPTESTDTDGIAAALRGVKHLSRAMEALAANAVGRGAMQIDAAVAALRKAAEMLRASYGDVKEVDAGESAVQLSVAQAQRVPNEEAINDALENLLNRTESEAFVIFVDAHTGNYLQFLGSKGAPLVLDLPFSDLSEEETERADEFFASKGLANARRDESFSVTIGRDSERATDLALGVFGQVYGSKPDFSLKIEEN